ncbi:hypothetical protein C900_01285 [Fulvivirga imtechensis AK7]|uniref:Uncharacterized protein n=1 Tax=Fulvivirga imtechensis AK7 TaxID=1237149 RepID=L8JIC0_9BACT|nr:hypothetical protein C900_01285 [Fulvivirga imtechensis AK7]
MGGYSISSRTPYLGTFIEAAIYPQPIKWRRKINFFWFP